MSIQTFCPFLNFIFFIFFNFWLCWVFVSVRGLSLVAASGGHSSSRCAGLSLSRPLLLRSTGSRRAGSVVVAHGPSCSAACGIFPDQGSNPCPLHRQADSQPLNHQGSPFCPFLMNICPLIVQLYILLLYIFWEKSFNRYMFYDYFLTFFGLSFWFFVCLFFNCYFILEHSLLTMLCYFQVYSKVVHWYTCIYLFFLKLFSQLGYYRVLSRVPCAIK